MEPRSGWQRLPGIVAESERNDSGRYGGTFDDLFDAHAAVVLAYAVRRTANVADAEDVVAETFVTAWRRFTDAPVEPRAWLYGIARRVLANHRRGADRRTSLLRRLTSLASRPHSPASSEGPALDALAKLSATDQELLRLVAWEELTHSEIAVVLGVSVNAVAIRLHRARQRFAAVLGPTFSDRLKDSAVSRTHTEQWMQRPTPAPKKAAR